MMALLCVAIKIIVLVAGWLLASRVSATPSLCGWDCGYYRTIAEHGYERFQLGHQTNLAFFPAFPFGVAFLQTFSFASFPVTAVLANLALFGVAIFLLMKWTHELGFGSPWLVAILFTFDRFTFWSHVPYTESLFVCVVLSFLLLARSRFSKTFGGQALIGLVAGLGTLVRLVGVSLIGSWGLARLKDYLRRPLDGMVMLALGLWGVAAYFGYLQVTQGSWKLSLLATAQWDRHFDVMGFVHSFIYLMKSAYFPTIVVMCAGFWVLILPPPSLRLTWTERWCFFFLAFIPMASTVMISLTRYMTMFLVGYLGWAWLISQFSGYRLWRWIWVVILIVELGQQVWLTQKFFLGHAFNWAG